MDDKPDNVPAQPDLAASIRQARVENAERAEAIAEVRELEIGRLTSARERAGAGRRPGAARTSTCSIWR